VPNDIKIDPYNFELYRFKVGAFFLRHSAESISGKICFLCLLCCLCIFLFFLLLVAFSLIAFVHQTIKGLLTYLVQPSNARLSMTSFDDDSLGGEETYESDVMSIQ